MEKKKYELVENDFIIHEGRKLYRIRALREFSLRYSIIKEGSIGGYVEGYHNLSQEGSCWIFCNAMVYGNAKVVDNAYVGGSGTEVYGNAVVKDGAMIEAKVYGNARIEDCAYVHTNAEIYGNAVVKGDARVYEDSQIYGNAKVKNTGVSNISKVYGNAVLKSYYKILGNVNVCDNEIREEDE